MAPISSLQFLRGNESFSEDIISATLNDASVSSALCSQGWRPRPVSCLPIYKFMPTLCFYPEHLRKITFLPLPVTQSMVIGPSQHSRLCIPLGSFCLFVVYMEPNSTFSMCSQLFLKFEYFLKDC